MIYRAKIHNRRQYFRFRILKFGFIKSAIKNSQFAVLFCSTLPPIMKPKDIFNDVAITGTTVDGLGIARIESWVVFIPKAIEGDVADIIITSKKRNHVFGKITELKKKSGQRTIPFCEHFGVCGGCSLQHIGYAEQLRIKQKFVEDTLKRIGKVEAEQIFPILPCDEIVRYRNRLYFAFGN